MQTMRRFFDFYLDASVHVALAVVALYGQTLLTFNITANPKVSVFLFCATIVCYNFMKYGVEAEKYVLVSNAYHRIIQAFSFLAFLGCLYFFWYLDLRLWICILILTLVSALYAIPFLPGFKNLRSLGGMKVFLVAFVWVGLTLVVPFVEAQLPIHGGFYAAAAMRFLLVVVLILPFEIRDLGVDDSSLRTLPQQFGVGRTKLLGYGLVTTMVFIFILTAPSFNEALHFSMLCVFLLLGLYFSSERNTKYYAGFWIESIPIAWWLLGLVMLRYQLPF
ncbi:MAG: hypothetical protein HRT65_01390 [Flavobacteriaceae bacterium]|nr:hypothetical protein [Flavobacteriaceae bacterium]